MNRRERRTESVKERRDQAARRTQRIRELDRLAKVNPIEAAEARDYEFVRKPAITHASRALAGLTREQKRKVLVAIVAACGGTIQWGAA
jgi:hypothetical protein